MELKCPKCGGEMEEGMMTPYDELLSLVWTNDKNTGGMLGKNYDVLVYRCKVCGYLESYAK